MCRVPHFSLHNKQPRNASFHCAAYHNLSISKLSWLKTPSGYDNPVLYEVNDYFWV
nr:MAG TPA: hypothetical protein [Caudoviricetes sp.]